jgi:hypothetical protein
LKLYHFTAREYLPAIAREGLWKGQVSVTATDHLNAVWVTSAPDPGRGSHHGLTDGRMLTPQEKALCGLPSDAPARFPDKRAIRLTVMIPRGDRKLVPWNTWSRKRLAPQWLSTLEGVGGGAAAARTWFLYWGAIPNKWVSEAMDWRAGTMIPWPLVPQEAAA